MNKHKIEHFILSAIDALNKNQPDLFDFAEFTNQTEWNLANHLAVELHKFLPRLSYDIDLIKRAFENKRPDIVFHKRGTHEHNFLVIELKFEGNEEDMFMDVDKIRNYWFDKPLSYQYGAYINLSRTVKPDVEVFENE